MLFKTTDLIMTFILTTECNNILYIMLNTATLVKVKRMLKYAQAHSPPSLKTGRPVR